MSTPRLESPDDFSVQRMEAINHLAAGVAHEFNNVLQIVRGYVSFARDALPRDSATREDLENALLATDRAAGLASRLLQFARADDTENSAADVNDAVGSLQMLLRPIIGENIVVSCDMEAELPHAVAGDASLRQALLNLCVNARDAMPSGGELSLRTALIESKEATPLTVGSLAVGPYVRVTVADTGEGMTPQTIQRVFQPFYTTKPPGEGTGLGLAMVATFAKSAGGAIGLKSQRGEGACFELFLPAADLNQGLATELGDHDSSLPDLGDAASDLPQDLEQELPTTVSR